MNKNQAIVFREHSTKTGFVSKEGNNNFIFDKYMDGGEMDNAFWVKGIDIFLIEWTGNEGYYDFAEEDEPEIYTKTKIGKILGHYYDIERMEVAEFDIMDAFDMHNSDECALGSEVLDLKWNTISTKITDKMIFWAPKNFFHIDEIKIKEEYRNKGYGTIIMSNIEKILYFSFHYSCSFITLQPNPLDEDKHNNKEEIKKLENFYKKCGFFKLQKNGGVMIKILEDFLDP